MAFTKKPLKWTALGQEPSELKKSEGFKMDESPAPGHFDFMFRSTYEAIEELQQKAGEVKTVNNVQPDVNGNVLITLPDTSKLYQKPTSGIPKTDLDATVQASLKKADDAAPMTELAKTNQTVAAHQADNTAHGIGDKSMLKTTDKTTIVGAVNELFTSVSNGKNEVANAITQKGQVANGSDTFTQLATSISAINTGKKWASGLVDSWDGKVIINNLPFKPSYVFISRQMLNGTSSPSINDSTSHHYMVDVLQGGYAYNSVSTSYNSNYYGVWSKNGVSWNENTSTLTLNSVPANVRNMNFLAIE